MARLFLIRHGEPETAWGAADDPGLSALGRRQAEAAAVAMAERGVLDLLSSPMRRCLETAAPYARSRGIRPRVEPRVSEVATPSGVADRRAWLLQNFPWQGGAGRAWRELAPELRSWREAILGFAQAFGEDAAVFTHFVAINAIVGAAMESDQTIVCRPGYASITELAVKDRALRLVRLGEEMRVGDVR